MRPIDLVLERLKRVKKSHSGWTALCPAHDDKSPSLTVSEGDDGRVLLHCHAGCTPAAIVASIGLTLADLFSKTETWLPAPRTVPEEPAFNAADAQRTWDLSLARARDDDAVDRDRPVYEYIRGRGLAETWEDGNFGILASDMPLPAALSWWPSNSYRLLGLLYDLSGLPVNVQARAIEKRDPRVLAPKGSRLQGTVFANASGLEVLRGTWTGSRCVLFGEGLPRRLNFCSLHRSRGSLQRARAREGLGAAVRPR